MTYGVYLEPRSCLPSGGEKLCLLLARGLDNYVLEDWLARSCEALSKLQSNLFWNLKAQAKNRGIGQEGTEDLKDILKEVDQMPSNLC